MAFVFDLKNMDITIDMVKDILCDKFRHYDYEFKKPIFGKRYLKVRQDNFVGAIVSVHKDKLKVLAWESNAMARSARQNLPFVGALTQNTFNTFEKQLGDYLTTFLINKRTMDGIRDGKPGHFPAGDHSKYMPK
ncbi:MAG: hypothetical protein JST26_20725 [Bacteroidetes bacterium]|nr:hypothetical protein [Bacteroidota bacterium]